MAKLFGKRHAPLALKLRPRSLDEIIGQEHLLGKNGKLRKLIESDILTSILLFGPAGTGKTTIAEIIALTTTSEFVRLNATQASVKDIRKWGKQAEEEDSHVVIFVDECLPYNSLIICKHNNIVCLKQIGEIVNKQLTTEVLSFNGDELEWKSVIGWMRKPKKKMIKLGFKEGEFIYYIKCTPDHLIYTSNRGYIEAQYLDDSDEIVSPFKHILNGEHKFDKDMQDMLSKISSKIQLD